MNILDKLKSFLIGTQEENRKLQYTPANDYYKMLGISGSATTEEIENRPNRDTLLGRFKAHLLDKKERKDYLNTITYDVRKDYYLILDALPVTSQEDIEKLYHEKTKSDPAHKNLYEEAFTVLNDKEARAVYDKVRIKDLTTYDIEADFFQILGINKDTSTQNVDSISRTYGSNDIKTVHHYLRDLDRHVSTYDNGNKKDLQDMMIKSGIIDYTVSKDAWRARTYHFGGNHKKRKDLYINQPEKSKYFALLRLTVTHPEQNPIYEVMKDSRQRKKYKKSRKSLYKKLTSYNPMNDHVENMKKEGVDLIYNSGDFNEYSKKELFEKISEMKEQAKHTARHDKKLEKRIKKLEEAYFVLFTARTEPYTYQTYGQTLTHIGEQYIKNRNFLSVKTALLSIATPALLAASTLTPTAESFAAQTNQTPNKITVENNAAANNNFEFEETLPTTSKRSFVVTAKSNNR